MKVSANIGFTSIYGAAIISAMVVWTTGCAGSSRPVSSADSAVAPDVQDTPGLLAGASTATVLADWNDIDAGVDFAQDEAELAVTESNAAEADRRVFALRSVLDEPGWLVITRSPAPSAPGEFADGEAPVLMTLRCTVGRFGNSRAEERFLRALTGRLGALKGVEFRPL